MPYQKNIVLVGLMGAGKSRVGRELAKLMSWPFVDADREVENAASMSIAEIFAQFGEMEFRAGERRVMQRLLAAGPAVIAAGGGAFIQPDIRADIKARAVSLWLKADLDILIERVSSSTHRPLLQGVDVAEKLRTLMEARYPIYAEAEMTFITERQSAKDMAEKIFSALKEKVTS